MKNLVAPFLLLVILTTSGCRSHRVDPATQNDPLQTERVAQQVEQDRRRGQAGTGFFSGLAQGARALFIDLPRFLIDQATGNTPLAAARQMEDRYFPDERRQGINRLVERRFGQDEPYVTRYQQIARDDPNFLVRATAIRALNRARHEPSIPLFIRALQDPHELVRLEAVKALNNMPHPDAARPLLTIIANPNEQRDVRIAAAQALRHYPTLDVARGLAAQLQNREFAIAWQSRRSLARLTGTDHGYDEAAWLNYLTTTPNPFG